MSGSDDDMPEAEPETLSRSRSRRTRVDKAARFDKLKQARAGGIKNKYEIAEVENVYDIVDEKTYSKKVRERQDDDWIIDDGTGYVEDGREIFDDDLVNDDETNYSKRKEKKIVSREEKKQDQKGFHSIRDMLSNMPAAKRKRDDDRGSTSKKRADDDDFLGDLMQELHDDKKYKTASTMKLIEKTKGAESFFTDSRTKKTTTLASPSSISSILKGSTSTSPSTSSTSPYSGGLKKKKLKLSTFTSTKIKAEAEDDYDYQVPSPISRSSKKNRYDEDDNNMAIPTDSFDQDDDDFRNFDDNKADNDHVKDKEIVAVPVESPTKKKNVIEEEIKQAEPVIVKQEANLNGFGDFESFCEIMNDIAQNDFDDQNIMNENEDEDDDSKTLNFYWYDMHEEPKSPGTLFVFGKVKSNNTYVSCCLVVKNLDRTVFLLPRETKDDGSPVSFFDIYNEFNTEIAPKHKIPMFRSKTSEKKYCFELKDIPRVASYLEVRYSGAMPQLASDLSGKTFSKVFGSNSSLMENFLLDKKLKGPSWLKIKNPTQVESGLQQSWCKLEFLCEVGDLSLHPDSQTIPIPTFTFASLNIQFVHDAPSKKDIIVFAGVTVNKNFSLQTQLSQKGGYYQDFFCLVNRPKGEVWPFDVDKVMNKRILKMDSERGLLSCLIAKLQQIDADIYLGHDLNLELLILQFQNHKVPHWSRIGRLKRSGGLNIGKTGKIFEWKNNLAGRLFCDVKISAMELIRARSYDISSLATQVLGLKEDEISTLSGPEIKQLFGSSEGIRSFINWGMMHSVLNIRLVNELQVMPLALQITTIAGNTLSRTLLGGRSERNEFLLLHAFHSKAYIVPDKVKPFSRFNKKDDDVVGEQDENAGGSVSKDKDKDKDKKSSGPSYVGGLVLAPKKGFYDNYIVLMDFNSLYPSIIQEFNVCFTTSAAVNGNLEEDSIEEKGILPEEIRKLVETRKQVKNLMKGENISPDLLRQYDIRQKALKLTANSMYGCLGFKNSRFYAKELAAMITGKGRDILMKTKETVEKMGFEVIYGDTDSIMINTNTTEIQKVYQIGNKIKSEINRTYKLLELEIDGIFRFLLLLQKKKYAALVYNPKDDKGTLELKGLDMVRRDWSKIAASTARRALDEIMTEQNLDDKIMKICKILEETAQDLKAGKIETKELLITKQLAKNPEDYKDSRSGGLYHVQVALRMNQSGLLQKKFKNGDTVSYLFCTDGLPHHIREMGSSLVTENKDDEAGTSSSTSEKKELKPDPEYYLAQQIHPVVSRICEQIPGLDPVRIAEALGLNPSTYKKRRVYDDSQDDKLMGEQSEKEKYKNCDRFSFRCANPDCKKEIRLEWAFTGCESEIKFSLEACPHCGDNLAEHVNHIENRLQVFMRKFVDKYYKNVYICEDPSCSNVQRGVSLKLMKGYPYCPCKQALMYKDFGDAALYNQLSYLQYVFDVDKQIEDLTETEKKVISTNRKNNDTRKTCERLYNTVTKLLDRSSYSQLKLGSLYKNLEIKRLTAARHPTASA